MCSMDAVQSKATVSVSTRIYQELYLLTRIFTMVSILIVVSTLISTADLALVTTITTIASVDTTVGISGGIGTGIIMEAVDLIIGSKKPMF